MRKREELRWGQVFQPSVNCTRRRRMLRKSKAHSQDSSRWIVPVPLTPFPHRFLEYSPSNSQVTGMGVVTTTLQISEKISWATLWFWAIKVQNIWDWKPELPRNQVTTTHQLPSYKYASQKPHISLNFMTHKYAQEEKPKKNSRRSVGFVHVF